jgi:hemoglobin/transferrin/lactoferrin receptor protein
VSTGFAQQVITVRDAENNDALEGVVIMGEPNGITAITNPNGRAEIIDLPDSARLVFRSLGYEIKRMTIGEIRSSGGFVYLQPARLSLEQVVVSATRWNQVSTRLPQKVSTLKPRDIQLYNPQTAADMLALTGEVFIQKSQQGGGSPMIRGFSANRLLYAVDGVRMNTAIFRSGNLQNVISLDPFAMESTEVLFGPGSVMYGSDAIGAVMDFRTIKPQFAAEEAGFVTGNASVRFATANREKTVHAHAKAGFDKWALVTSLTFTDYEDLIMGKHGPDDYLRTFYVERIGESDQIIPNDNPRIQIPSGFSQRNIMQKISFRPDPLWELEYAFHHSRISEYDRYDRLIITTNGEPRSAEWKYGPQKWDMHQLAVNNKRSRGWYSEMTTRAYYQYFQESRIDRNFNDALRRTRTENVDVFGLNLDFTKRLNAKTTLNYGGEYVFNSVGSRGTGENIENGTSPPVASRYPDANWQSASLYALG